MRYKINKKKLNYFKTHWKLGIHLVFRTKHFGVNNQWWEPFDSLFGWPWRKKLTLLWPPNFIQNIKLIKMRMAPGIALVQGAEYKLVWKESWFNK